MREAKTDTYDKIDVNKESYFLNRESIRNIEKQTLDRKVG